MKVDDLIKFISEYFEIDLDDLNEDTNLFKTGIVDSFSILEIILYIENITGIKLEDYELYNKDAYTPKSIVNLVQQILNK